MGDGRQRNRAGFGLGHVGFKMPAEYPGGGVQKVVECVHLELKRKVYVITDLKVDFLDNLTVPVGFTDERT